MPHKHFTFSSSSFPKRASKPLGPTVRQGVAFSFWYPPARCAELSLRLLGRDSASLPACSSCSGWDAVAWCSGLSSAATSWALQALGKGRWCSSPRGYRVVGLFVGLRAFLVAAALVLGAAIHVGTLLRSCRDGRKPLSVQGGSPALPGLVPPWTLSPVWSGPSGGRLGPALADLPPRLLRSQRRGCWGSIRCPPPRVALCTVGWLLQRQQGGPGEGVEGGP